MYALPVMVALDHIGENIRVNCVCPATIETDMVRQMLSEAADLGAATRNITAKHPTLRYAKATAVVSLPPRPSVVMFKSSSIP